jgi:hypothetical protein
MSFKWISLPVSGRENVTADANVVYVLASVLVGAEITIRQHRTQRQFTLDYYDSHQRLSTRFVRDLIKRGFIALHYDGKRYEITPSGGAAYTAITKRLTAQAQATPRL